MRDTKPAAIKAEVSYGGHRFSSDVIERTVWLYGRPPLSLRVVKEILAAHSIEASYKTVRCWTSKFG